MTIFVEITDKLTNCCSSVPVEVDPPVGFDDENPKSDFEEEVISTSDPVSNQTEVRILLTKSKSEWRGWGGVFLRHILLSYLPGLKTGIVLCSLYAKSFFLQFISRE